MADRNSNPSRFGGSSSGQEIKGVRKVNQSEELPSASHKSVHVDKPAELIGLEDPSQEHLPVHKTGMADSCKQRFKETTEMKENDTQGDLDLTLRLKPPEAVQEDEPQQFGPSGKRPKVHGNTEKYDGPSLVVMECTGCSRHVMVSEIAPQCPLCRRSSRLFDKLRRHS